MQCTGYDKEKLTTVVASTGGHLCTAAAWNAKNTIYDLRTYISPICTSTFWYFFGVFVFAYVLIVHCRNAAAAAQVFEMQRSVVFVIVFLYFVFAYILILHCSSSTVFGM